MAGAAIEACRNIAWLRKYVHSVGPTFRQYVAW